MKRFKKLYYNKEDGYTLAKKRNSKKTNLYIDMNTNNIYINKKKNLGIYVIENGRIISK